MGINDKKDEAFASSLNSSSFKVSKAKSILDDAAENLDEKTLARLRQARMQALESVTDSKGVNWMLPAGGFAAIATVAVLSVSIWSANWSTNWSTNMVERELADAFNDIDLLTSTESLEFYEELEFYAWIDEQDA
ncbi:MAG: DUF3619 family protein [Gammaproteobacteria bacterium]|nr:DUF3619 family protein [Gammaproteobacteria bacterium]